MEAIMKAFEKMEKREERQKQQHNRNERKSVDVKKEDKVCHIVMLSRKLKMVFWWGHESNE
jgi:ribosomal protein S25